MLSATVNLCNLDTLELVVATLEANGFKVVQQGTYLYIEPLKRKDKSNENTRTEAKSRTS